MRQFLLAISLIAGSIATLPSTANAQLINPAFRQGIAQRQVISWFQAYLGRLPTVNELAVLSNQYMLTGNPLYVQSVILASNEFYLRAGGTPAGFITRLFALTIGRAPTLQEIASMQNQVIYNGRLWFVQTYLSQVAGGWQFNNWNNFAAANPVPVVVPIIVR